MKDCAASCCPKFADLYFSLRLKEYEAHIFFSLGTSLSTLCQKLSRLSEIYRYLLYNFSHQSALELVLFSPLPTSSPSQDIIAALFLTPFKGYREKALHRHVMK